MKFSILILTLTVATTSYADMHGSKKKSEKPNQKMDHMHDKNYAHGKDHKHKKVEGSEKDIKMLFDENQKSDIVLKVKGMFCAFCAQGVKRILSKDSNVKNVDVNLDIMSVFVNLKKDKNIENKKLTKAIVDSGFAVVSISRKKK